MSKVKEILNKLSESEEDVAPEIEEEVRLGKYEEGKNRLLILKLTTKETTEFILNSVWKLTSVGKTRMYINRNMVEEERLKKKKLLNTASIKIQKDQ